MWNTARVVDYPHVHRSTPKAGALDMGLHPLQKILRAHNYAVHNDRITNRTKRASVCMSGTKSS